MGINDIIEYIGQGDWTASADGGFVIVYQPSTTDPSGKILTQSRGYAFPASALGGGGVQSVTGANVDNADPSNPVITAPYLVYTALLSQNGTDAPTAIVLENTTGLNITWLYSQVGQYDIDTSVIFDTNKTTFTLTLNYGVGNVSTFGPGFAGIRTREYDGTLRNGDINRSLLKSFFEIKIYP